MKGPRISGPSGSQLVEASNPSCWYSSSQSHHLAPNAVLAGLFRRGMGRNGRGYLLHRLVAYRLSSLVFSYYVVAMGLQSHSITRIPPRFMSKQMDDIIHLGNRRRHTLCVSFSS